MRLSTSSASRTSVVAILLAIELVLLSFMIAVFRGPHGTLGIASGIHAAAFKAHAIDAIDAGLAPDVHVSDPSSRVSVTRSPDGRIHIIDRTSVSGLLVGGTPRQLEVTRSGSSVRVERLGSMSFGVIGSIRNRIELALPPGAHVEIEACAGADVSGINGGTQIHTKDGSIVLTGVSGDTIVARSNDGRIELNDVSARSLDAVSNDGSIHVDGLTIAGTSPRATIHSDDGSVHVNGRFAPAGTYEVSSSDGTVNLTVGARSDMTIDASTGDGTVTIDGVRVRDADSRTVRLGSGSSAMRVNSADGSVHIMTNGGY